MGAYDFLAEWFETLNDDCDYFAWSQYFIEGLARLGAGKRGLELGCGSGAFCRALQRAGYFMSGADLSLPMLTEAEKRAREEGLSISFFRADAAALRAPERYDFILAPNDVFNYIPREKLPRAFRAVKRCLVPGGIFWFDVSSPHKLLRKVADTVSVDDREEVTYLGFHRGKEDCVETDVTLFVRRGDGSYSRFDERHIQYIHEEETLKNALLPDFEVLSAEGALGGEKAESDRVNFICRSR